MSNFRHAKSVTMLATLYMFHYCFVWGADTVSEKREVGNVGILTPPPDLTQTEKSDSQILRNFTRDELNAELKARSQNARREVRRRELLSAESSKVQSIDRTESIDSAQTESTESIYEPDNGSETNSKLSDIDSEDIIAFELEREKSVYGSSGGITPSAAARKEIIQVVDPVITAEAMSVAALVDSQNIVDKGDGTSELRGQTLTERNHVCPETQYANQKECAYGSAFLVGTDKLFTASHCVSRKDVPESYWSDIPEDFSKVRVVFGYKNASLDSTAVIIKNSDIYTATVIDRSYSEHGSDWAVIKVDRPVTSCKPLILRKSGKILDNAKVYTIGYPNGLPEKFADNALISNNSDATCFSAYLDTFGGNSGSPVFNALTNEVEGILVRGQSDFKPSGNGYCYYLAVYPTTGATGEECTRITEVAHYLSSVSKKLLIEKRTNRVKLIF